MPRREDERWRSLSKRHPAACTCKDCTERFLKKKGINVRGEAANKPHGKDRVKRHSVDCKCASCKLLRSMNPSDPGSSGGAGG